MESAARAGTLQRDSGVSQSPGNHKKDQRLTVAAARVKEAIFLSLLILKVDDFSGPTPAEFLGLCTRQREPVVCLLSLGHGSASWP